ncbi:hypothetical protein ECGR_2522 [Escherichia coli]|uniref:Uncharacterized protein n=1 Tax=Salmonella enterica subsp. enterica serovar 4,[5],12:i:- TaxID=440524 RepID=A0A8D5INA9_SALET|nr:MULTISPECIES: hypothetical protein [Enterobacteriaceae]BCI29593.1 hypothetical protein SEL4596_P1480 [Salmonella enterica subsp. enterica serovar 4,[5],12:i:-]GJJ30459.1 hypothetical protein ECGR_2522 [Escherichia coli]
MSEPVDTSFYGVKNSSFEELLTTAKGLQGGQREEAPEQLQVIEELKVRLPKQLIELFEAYVVAYADREKALNAISADLKTVKT